MKDFRRLFPDTTRKPGEWSEPVRILLQARQISAICQMPVIGWPRFTSPLHNHSRLVIDRELRKTDKSIGLEYLVIKTSGARPSPGRVGVSDLAQLFYVNCEGYDYARYVARIDNMSAQTVLEVIALREILSGIGIIPDFNKD